MLERGICYIACQLTSSVKLGAILLISGRVNISVTWQQLSQTEMYFKMFTVFVQIAANAFATY